MLPYWRMFSARKRAPVTTKILGWDTEDDGNGHFQGGCVYDPETKETRFFSSRSRMRAYLESPDHADTTFWAHNAEYDIGNIWGIDIGKFSLYLRAGDAFRIAKLTHSGGGETLFQDTFGHVQLSLSKIAEYVNLKKSEDPFQEWLAGGKKGKMPAWNDRRAYCAVDARIVGDMAYSLQIAYADLGTSLRASAGGSAIELLQRKYWHEDMPPLPPALWHFMRSGYNGGRTECFHLGTVPGPVYYYDVNSLYPYMMGQLNFWHTAFLQFKKTPRPVCLDYEGVSRCTVEYKRDQWPILPIRHEGKLVFPLGVFTGTWPNLSIREAQRYGARVLKIWSTCTSVQSDKYLAPIATDLYKIRIDRKGEFIALAAKWLGNALSGKFGQGETAYKFSNGKFIQEKISPPVYSNLWSAQITGGAHCHMRQLFDRETLYTDTDSLLTTRKYPIGNNLGDLKIEGTYGSADIIMPKGYRLRDENGKVTVLHAKGVPNQPNPGDIISPADVYLDWGEACFRRPVRMRSAINGRGNVNVWEDRTRQRRTTEIKRAVNPDGSTAPLTIIEPKPRP